MAKANKRQAYADQLRGLSDRALDQERKRVDADYTNAVLRGDVAKEAVLYADLGRIDKELARRKHEADVARKLRD